MTTVGTSGWGVILASADASGPSGDICYLFCDSVKRKINKADKPTHVANQTSFAVVLKNLYYTVDVRNAVVVGNAISTLNSYHALMKAWLKQAASVYLYIKDGSTYLDFEWGGSTYDYLKCRIIELEDDLAHNKKLMTFKVEECT